MKDRHSSIDGFGFRFDYMNRYIRQVLYPLMMIVLLFLILIKSILKIGIEKHGKFEILIFVDYDSMNICRLIINSSLCFVVYDIVVRNIYFSINTFQSTLFDIL